MLDVETIPASDFKAGFVPGTGLGTFTAKPDPTDKSAKPGDPLAAAQVTKSDVHVSTADNPITTSKDIVFPDGTRLPAGSKFSPGTTYDGDSFKSMEPNGKVWATTPDGKMIQIAAGGASTNLPTELRFKPDDLVAVNKGSGTEFMLARDLEAFARTSSFFHYGENALLATMDVAMVVSGTVELGAAVKGARLLAAGVEVAGLSSFDVGLTAAKGAWDLGLGVTGITGNAAFQATDEGRELAWLRGMAFIGHDELWARRIEISRDKTIAPRRDRCRWRGGPRTGYGANRSTTGH